MFDLNQKIVCIDDDFTPSLRVDSEMGLFNTYPKKDQSYTVRGFYKNNGGIYLNEIKNFPALYSDGFGERSFKSTRFIPIEEYEHTESLVAELIESSQITNTIYN